MDPLVRKLGEPQPVVIGGRVETASELKAALDRGYVHVRFSETGTELSCIVNWDGLSTEACDFEQARGSLSLVSRPLKLNEEAVRVVATIELKTLRGTGLLELADDDDGDVAEEPPAPARAPEAAATSGDAAPKSDGDMIAALGCFLFLMAPSAAVGLFILGIGNFRYAWFVALGALLGSAVAALATVLGLGMLLQDESPRWLRATGAVFYTLLGVAVVVPIVLDVTGYRAIDQSWSERTGVLLVAAVWILGGAALWSHFRHHQKELSVPGGRGGELGSRQTADPQPDSSARSPRTSTRLSGGGTAPRPAAGEHLGSSAALSAERLAGMVRSADVEGLREAFSLAASWTDREMIAATFEMFVDEHQESTSVQQHLRGVLEDVVSLCNAETGGGSYRENCLEAAERALARCRT